MKLHTTFFEAEIVIIIVGVDLLIFRNHLAKRFATNVEIVLIYGTYYWRLFSLEESLIFL